MNNQSNRGDAAFELTAFLVASARGSLEEGVFTASYRLLDAIRRLGIAYPELLRDPFQQTLVTTLAHGLSKAYLQSEGEYRLFLDELLGAVGQEAKRRAVSTSEEGPLLAGK